MGKLGHLKPVTGKELAGLFSSEDFKKRICRAAKYTASKGYESGFCIMRYIDDGKYWFTDVVEGKTDRTGIFTLEDLSQVACGGMYSVFLFHFHPDQGIMPSGSGGSGGDLWSLSKTRRYEEVYFRPIMGVGIIDKKKGEILLVQEKTKKPMKPRQIDAIERDLIDVTDGYRKAARIVDEFNKTSFYKAASLGFNLAADNIFDPEELGKLDALAFQPKSRRKKPDGYL